MRLTKKPDILAAVLASTLTATPALTQSTDPPIRIEDEARLSVLDESLGHALRQAFAGGDKAGLAVVTEALNGQPLPPDQALSALEGEWNCRTIKLGGNLPLVVYEPFRCHADGTAFEKLTGSQRTKGSVYEYNGALIYLGTGYVSGDNPPDYTGLPPETDPQASPQRLPQAGLVEMTSDQSGRIILPRPYVESETDLLVLTR